MFESILYSLLVFGVVNLAVVGGLTAYIAGIVLRQRAAERELRLRIALARRGESG